MRQLNCNSDSTACVCFCNDGIPLAGCHQALAALLHASLFPAQFLFSLAQRVRLLGGLAAVIDFGLD